MKKMYWSVILIFLSVLVAFPQSSQAAAKKPKTQDQCIAEKWKCSITAYTECAPLYRIFDPTGGPVDGSGNPVGVWILDESNPAFKACKTSKEQACYASKGCA